MKAVLAIVLLCGAITAHAGAARQLLQEAPSTAPSLAPGECVGQPTVFDVARQNGLNQLVEALSLDDLESSLDNDTSYPLQYTVFAPTDEALSEALASWPSGATTLDRLRETGDLNALLQYHFLIQPYTESELESRGTISTNYQNQTLSFGPDGSITAYGSNATIVTPNVQACQTIIHVIDGVLVPNLSSPAPEASAASA